MGRKFSAAEEEELRYLVDWKEDDRIDLRTWLGIAALSERVFGQYDGSWSRVRAALSIDIYPKIIDRSLGLLFQGDFRLDFGRIGFVTKKLVAERAIIGFRMIDLIKRPSMADNLVSICLLPAYFNILQA